MIYIFEVYDIHNECGIGFVKDALLNLSSNPKKAKQLTSNGRFELISQAGVYQERLDMILDGDVDPDLPIARLCERVYDRHYKGYHQGQLRIVPKPYFNY